MKLTLNALSIRNFKCFSDKRIDFGGNDAVISGRNASGKTTIYDAFLWLLFGKDSAGCATFAFKPLDADGNEIHNLETSVEAEILIDGTSHTLRRVSTEKWTKPRGQAERVFGGDTTAFWIDDVPRTMAEYKRFIDGLIPEAQFRLITNHTAFMAQKPADRRSVLVGMAVQGVDKKLAATMPEAFAALEGLSPEDARKKLREQRKRLNQEADTIPARIDELHRSIGDANEALRPQFAGEADALTREIARIADRLASDPMAEARTRYTAVDREIAAIEAAKRREHALSVDGAQARLTQTNSALGIATDHVSGAEIEADRCQSEVARLEARVSKLRADYNAAFSAPDNGTCASCGQALPPEKVKAAKAATLAKIKEDGKAAAEALEAARKSLSAARERIITARDELKAATEAQETAQSAHDVIRSSAISYGAEHAALVSERDALSQRLAQPADAETARLREQKADFEAVLERKRALVAQIDAAAKARARIAELEEQLRSLGDQIAATDRRLMLVDEYVSARCKMLESSINALFPTIRWRLFVQQDNGGIKDACDCMIPAEGGAFVPYESANNGARINAGLEIINALCRATGNVAPLFVDNSEGVNEIIPTDGQQIKLEVTDGPLTVRVEKKEAA
jgi:DNA repair exonuclease SbcCD ATPase subunit